ncbi:MAG: TFIIB-type zinc ribbon-containing protein, partial [Haloarculaceae archaeon]
MTDSVRGYTAERARARESEDETESTEADDEQLRCPECGGQLATDTEHGETVCADCGLVVEADE